MRRKSDKEIRKECKIFIVLGVISISFGIFSLLLPLMPATPYDEYMEKEVIISEINHYYGYRSSSYDYIVTKDGEVYNITGKYNTSKLFELLAEETPARIKYDVNKIFPFKKYVEEMTVNDIQVVKYDNDQPINWTFPVIASSICFLIGAGFLFVCRAFIIRNRKMQAKRDERIMKKYGRLKK